MSDHQIGVALNSVLKVVIDLYDEKKINIEAAKKIAIACKNAVNWGDGNEFDATDYISNNRCGYCLELLPKGDKLYSIWAINEFVDLEYNSIASEYICEKCLDYFCKGDIQKKQKVEDEYQKGEMNVSTGEKPKTNNGYDFIYE